MHPRTKVLAAVLAWMLCVAAGLGGCDNQRIAELSVGQSTEADVRAKFGEPEKVWDGPDGSHVFEYNRQPNGVQNYHITVSADGRMTSLVNVLNRENFAKVQPGMLMEDVRRLLGRPAKTATYSLKQQSEYDWRFQPPGSQGSRLFTVVFDADMKVVRTHEADDLPVSGG